MIDIFSTKKNGTKHSVRVEFDAEGLADLLDKAARAEYTTAQRWPKSMDCTYLLSHDIREGGDVIIAEYTIVGELEKEIKEEKENDNSN